ncbi:hypothetical protein [Chitinimonas sp.]|uniref:hypothetical protein n=1 Tax=Chitinimonas sp. TaxID=1934313 RepID=UPI002F9444A1
MSLLVSPQLIARLACAGLAVNLAASMVEPAVAAHDPLAEAEHGQEACRLATPRQDATPQALPMSAPALI